MADAEACAGGVWEEVQTVERGTVGVDVCRRAVLPGFAPPTPPRRFDVVRIVRVAQMCVSPKGVFLSLCAP